MSVVDMRIDIDGYSPKFPTTPQRSVSLPSFAAISGRSRNRRFFYAKLPEEPLKLSILKLDGSCFDIQLMKTATVAELRHAVEDAFSYMPRKGPGKISWPHVWSHFCLTYDGRKLVIENDYIRNYGIRDGDQLQFIRHISNSFTLKKKRSTKHIADSDHHEMNHVAHLLARANEISTNCIAHWLARASDSLSNKRQVVTTIKSRNLLRERRRRKGR